MKRTASKRSQLRDPVDRAWGTLKHLGKTSDEIMRELRGDPNALDDSNLKKGAMKAVVSEKGQVTIPKRLRQRLGIRSGEVLEFAENHGRLIIQKADSEQRDPIELVYGILGQPGSTDKWIEEIRGKAELP